MPANLNALIRYRTIDKKLFGGIHRTITELQEACSDALYENRAKEDLVSERTIRDDIKVMRSDMLGYNAPIMVKESKYYYDPKEFTIALASIPWNNPKVVELILETLKEKGVNIGPESLGKSAYDQGRILASFLHEKNHSPVEKLSIRYPNWQDLFMEIQ